MGIPSVLKENSSLTPVAKTRGTSVQILPFPLISLNPGSSASPFPGFLLRGATVSLLKFPCLLLLAIAVQTLGASVQNDPVTIAVERDTSQAIAYKGNAVALITLKRIGDASAISGMPRFAGGKNTLVPRYTRTANRGSDYISANTTVISQVTIGLHGDCEFCNYLVVRTAMLTVEDDNLRKGDIDDLENVKIGLEAGTGRFYDGIGRATEYKNPGIHVENNGPQPVYFISDYTMKTGYPRFKTKNDSEENFEVPATNYKIDDSDKIFAMIQSNPEDNEALFLGPAETSGVNYAAPEPLSARQKISTERAITAAAVLPGQDFMIRFYRNLTEETG